MDQTHNIESESNQCTIFKNDVRMNRLEANRDD